MNKALKIVIAGVIVSVFQGCMPKDLIERMDSFSQYMEDEETVTLEFDGSFYHVYWTHSIFLGTALGHTITGFHNNSISDSLSIYCTDFRSSSSNPYDPYTLIIRIPPEDFVLDTEINLDPNRQSLDIVKEYYIFNGDYQEHCKYETAATVRGGHISFSLINTDFLKPISGTFDIFGYYTDMEGETRTFKIEDGYFYVYLQKNGYR